MTFIQPGMLKGKPHDCMEPLVFALLKSLTPESVKTDFYDDRLKNIPFDDEPDSVVLSIGTFTAKRSYQIAGQYRAKGIPVIAGGFHPTLCPDEVSRYVDCIIIGDAEDVWPGLISDLQKRKLKKVYKSRYTSFGETLPDRSIFHNHKYLPINFVQFGRGCPHHCDFCSIHAFYGNNMRHFGYTNH